MIIYSYSNIIVIIILSNVIYVASIGWLTENGSLLVNDNLSLYVNLPGFENMYFIADHLNLKIPKFFWVVIKS